MKPAEDNPTSVETPADGKDEVTGLPGLRTWRGVYIFVFGCFILWVALLLALTVSFS
jgi:hypothetical protein